MDLQTEKILAVEGIDSEHSERYNVPSDVLENANKAMASMSMASDVVKKGNIITGARTAKNYELIWDHFKEHHAENFKKYMGYSVKEIEVIGVNKFIDFIDWRCTADVDKWKEDRIKVVRCAHCKNEFTTYQMDFGLCDKCKKSYDLTRFEEVCQAMDEQNPGSASAYIMMFVYINEFRELYKNFNFTASLVEDMIRIDDLSGMFTYTILKDYVVSSEDNADQFLATCDRIYKQHPEYNGQEKYKSLKAILTSSDCNVSKIDRIKPIYGV